MMPLPLLVSLYEFRQFVQIVLWIAVPATLIAVGLTIFFHYRRRKKHQELELSFNDDNSWAEKLARVPAVSPVVQATAGESPEALPDWLASSDPDNTTLIKKYEHEVRRYRENYAILEQDFRELEEKYTDLRNKAYNGATVSGDTNDERIQALQQMLAQAETERKTLKEKLAEQEYLPDVLEEKKEQIDFLQRQLEQRIKNYHLLEHQAAQSAAQLQQLQTTVRGFDQQIRQLTDELQLQQQQAAGWLAQLEQSREERQQQQEIIQLKTGHIEKLEHNIKDLQQQLEQSSQLLLKIYTELSKTINHSDLTFNVGSPAISRTKEEVLQLEE